MGPEVPHLHHDNLFDQVEGKRYDTGKLRLDLNPVDALESIAEVWGFGAKKYGDRNWEKGMDWNRVFGSLLRHLFSWWKGEHLDKESGLPHLAHAGANVLMLISYEKRNIGKDNR